MPGKKSAKQRRKELAKRRKMQKPLTKGDLVRYGSSLKKGQKW